MDSASFTSLPTFSGHVTTETRPRPFQPPARRRLSTKSAARVMPSMRFNFKGLLYNCLSFSLTDCYFHPSCVDIVRTANIHFFRWAYLI